MALARRGGRFDAVVLGKRLNSTQRGVYNWQRALEGARGRQPCRPVTTEERGSDQRYYGGSSLHGEPTASGADHARRRRRGRRPGQGEGADLLRDRRSLRPCGPGAGRRSALTTHGTRTFERLGLTCPNYPRQGGMYAVCRTDRWPALSKPRRGSGSMPHAQRLSSSTNCPRPLPGHSLLQPPAQAQERINGCAAVPISARLESRGLTGSATGPPA